ncbi:cobalt ECF transporter T component CbiQ [Candidatus Formimonas warabiya]|uniref:Cobalt ECF transporter T component CbiQ n=2 Tax=Formimonas warabiya TaxID=1761012 RepID=A0A3G1L2L0_FORW1|nr:cobalt ECF transporter T component CbiQ [Candidatus Formimonas warabiya]
MFYVDQFVYSNKMRTAHPAEKFAFAMVTLGICLMVKKPLINFIIIAMMLGLLIFRARIPGKVVLKLMLMPLSFLLIGVLTVAVVISSNHTGMLASLTVGHFYLGVTENSLNLAWSILLRALSSVTCLYFLALTVPMIELIYVLQRLKVPAICIELMMLMYRFIFVFVETAFNIYTAQSSRWGYCNFKRSIHSFGVLFGNLCQKVFFKTKSLYDCLLSRGYENELKVINPQYRFSLVNIAVFSFIDLGLIIFALI